MMAIKNLLIIHQGALGDFILTFPAVIRLHKYFDGIDVLCQSGLGKLARSLGLVENFYPLEAAHVATLFSDTLDPKIKALLAAYANVVLFTLSKQLKQNVRDITSVPVCCIPPKPPEYVCTHLTKFVLENLLNCGLIKKQMPWLKIFPLITGGAELNIPKRYCFIPEPEASANAGRFQISLRWQPCWKRMD